jgi:hypothetical protein
MGLTDALARKAIAPLRLGLSAGELGLQIALGIVRGTRRALDGDHAQPAAATAERFRSVPPEAPHPSPERPRREPPRRAEPRQPRRAEPSPEVAERPPPVPPAAAEGPAVPVVPPPPGAKQIDDDPVPVAEFSEAGAEDGAGAQVSIDEPWDGYDGMTAAQIQQRLAAADRAVVAAVSLYEGSGRSRVSVIRAADRRLRLLSA